MNTLQRLLLPALLATAPLAAQAQAPTPLPFARPEAEGVNPARLGILHEVVKGYVEEGKYAGAVLMVVRHGKIVDWQHYGVRDADSGAGMENNTICRVYSMTKVVTAVATLQLIEDGRLSLDSHVTNWIPELAGVQVCTGGTAEAPQLAPLRGAITVRECLNHTAGFSYEFMGDSPVSTLYKRADLWNAVSLDDFIARLGRLPLVEQPGVAFHYSMSDDVLGVLIQRVSGLKFEDYCDARIFRPLRMKDTSFDVADDKTDRLARLHTTGPGGKPRTIPPIYGAYAEPGRGWPAGGAGLFCTIGDYARFAQMLLNGGTLDGARVLGRKTVEWARLNSLEMLAPEHRRMNPSDGWGLFSAVRLDVAASGEPGSVGTLFWSGAATTHFFIDPQEQLIGLVFCQHDPFDQYGLFPRFRTAVYQALQ